MNNVYIVTELSIDDYEGISTSCHGAFNNFEGARMTQTAIRDGIISNLLEDNIDNEEFTEDSVEVTEYESIIEISADECLYKIIIDKVELL